MAGETSFRAEVLRKAIHLGSLIIPLFAYYNDKLDTLIFLTGLLALSLFIEWGRYHQPQMKYLIDRYFSFLYRGFERDGSFTFRKLTGATWMLVSAIITFSLFPREIAVAAFSFLVLGDTAAALIGKRFGTWRFGKKKKSIEGTIAFFAICTIVVLCIPELSLLIGCLGALTAALAEALIPDVDDNFSVPLSASIVMSLLAALL